MEVPSPRPSPKDRHDPLPSRAEIEAVISAAANAAREYLASVDDRAARSQRAETAAEAFGGPLPETGVGAERAICELVERGLDATVTSSGPRVFHFVIGGTTPAALGGDWLTSALDQMAYAWVASPLGTRLEVVALDWLRDLFELRGPWQAVMTTGATMANFVGLGAARQWWAEGHGVDAAEDGLTGLPPFPVFASGYIHASVIKAVAMLGIGRTAVRIFARDATGRVDLDALRTALGRLRGAPAIIVSTAGEVNAGHFDPIADLADLAQTYGAWLHVDGAFGLFARLSPGTRALTGGVERADSITVDGHKWLNVPYDCGFAFVRRAEPLARAFAYRADYLADPSDQHPNFGIIGPESSRRARALAVWATLRAYGRAGYRTMVERHLELSQHLASLVDAAPDLERLAEVPLNIVCFRFNPGGLDDACLDNLNTCLGDRLIADGRVYAGTTRYAGRVALRPAIVNWRTRQEDVELFVNVVREIGARLT